MSVNIIVGVQWGDEGKGKIVDYLTKNVDFVVRFQGGNNAGHTVVVDGKKTALQLIPSGILRDSARCLLASGVVVNPISILEEIDRLASVGIIVSPERLGIAAEVQLIMPYHMAVDAAREEMRMSSKIGTTGKGIGPTYEHSVSRSGIRMIDLTHPDYLKKRVEQNVLEVNHYLEGVLGSTVEFDSDEVFEQLMTAGERLKPYITNVSIEVNQAIKENRNVLFEGAQGSMLDVMHGTYPYVTSSHTVSSYACASAGFGPQYVNEIIGICKAYCTRVGGGPFPTEDSGSDGEILRVAGGEYGTVTGRPRRCGWFDAMAVKRASRLSGMTKVIITKLDVLTGFETIKFGIEYRQNNKILEDLPASWLDIEDIDVQYEELPGWKEDITGVRSFEELPVNAQRVITFIGELIDCEVAGFSIGPDRVQTVLYDSLMS